ncbi:MAG: electron transfer flavoprotein-ubiquinone oxidoreductase [Gammaproteobacteria bacterium]
MSREKLEFDILIVGAGPAGLSCAIELAKRASSLDQPLNIGVVEKGSEVGAHILSGAVLDPRALDELLPDWRNEDAPIKTPVARDRIMLLTSKWGLRVPTFFAPFMHNKGNYVISLGNLCRWLAKKAEALAVNIFPGFAAAELLIEDGRVVGVVTGDMGVDAKGAHKASYQEGIELRARYTVFSEGCRGHLGKQLIAHFGLDEGKDPQHYGIGLKEIWKLAPDRHEPGLVIHTTGWPSQKKTVSGSFLYHGDNGEAAVGYVVPLSYKNPYLNPFEEFQQWKQHPAIRRYLEGGERLSYGARALIKGGPQSRPRMWFNGGLLIGDDAGTLNFARIKGTHTAMKSGMLAAQCIVDVWKSDAEASSEDALCGYEELFRASWLHDELMRNRNFGALLHRFGGILGAALAFVEQGIFRGKLMTLSEPVPDYAETVPAAKARPIEYPKPDNTISFDRLSSVFLSNTNHEEDQMCHLRLTDKELPIRDNLPTYAEPAQRYCPAGVYEVVGEGDAARFVINAQNCVHCKTCDIKDPAQNINWVTPEGGGGPNYPNM